MTHSSLFNQAKRCPYHQKQRQSELTFLQLIQFYFVQFLLNKEVPSIQLICHKEKTLDQNIFMPKRFSLKPADNTQNDLVKQEYSQVFTLKSIQSEQQYLEIAPYYQRNVEYSLNSGRWNSKEHVKYVMFINYFEDIFHKKHNKRLWKIFSVMSSFIKTRNSSQCRSHHQKFERKYSSNTKEIVAIERKRYLNYDAKFQQLKKNLQKIDVQYPEEKLQSGDSCSVSIKILQQEKEQHLNYSSHSSLKDINFKQKLKKISLIQLDNHQLMQKSTHEFIKLKSQKYIGSQCSIQVQDEQKNQNEYIFTQYEKNPYPKQYKKQEIKEELRKTNDTYTEEIPSYVKKPKKVKSSIMSFADDADQFFNPQICKNTVQNYQMCKKDPEYNNGYLFSNFSSKQNTNKFEVQSCNNYNSYIQQYSQQSESGNLLINGSIQNSIWTNFISSVQSQESDRQYKIEAPFQDSIFSWPEKNLQIQQIVCLLFTFAKWIMEGCKESHTKQKQYHIN